MSIHQYANKETRDRLGYKSLSVYGRRSKWQKVMKERGLDIKQIEQVLDGMLKIIMEANSERNEARSTETGHESNPEQSDNGSGEGDDLREEEVRSS